MEKGMINLEERKGSTTKNIALAKAVIQIWRRGQELCRQTEVKRGQHHQSSFTRNVKGTYIVKKYKRRKISTKSNPKELRKWQ